MRMRDVMNEDVLTVAASATAEEAWNLMKSRRYRHLAVMDGKHLAGVITDRDLGGPRGRSVRTGRRVSELMSSPPVTASADSTLRQAANRMRNQTIGSLLVVDEGRLTGIVTISDLLDALGRGVERPAVRRKKTKDRRVGFPPGHRRRQ